MEAVWGLARAAWAKGDTAQAVERAAMVATHSATEHKTRQAAAEFLERLAHESDAQTFQAARTRDERAAAQN
ncbi:hypothetical protein FBQ82_03195 [Anaerolineae bacterium CFX7]|nr:hypothetical protein [Anaerolineae bacterium CFX7]